jgi:hypothetical protein
VSWVIFMVGHRLTGHIKHVWVFDVHSPPFAHLPLRSSQHNTGAHKSKQTA